MVEEEQQHQHPVNGGVEVDGVENIEKSSSAAAADDDDSDKQRRGNGVVNGNGHRDDVDGSYVFVGNRDNDGAEAVGGSPRQPDSVVEDKGDLQDGFSLEVVPEAVDSGKESLDAGDDTVAESPVEVHGDFADSQQPEIPSDHNQEEPVSDDCNSVAVESQVSLQEASDCPAALPCISNGEEESEGMVSSEPMKESEKPPVSTIEVDEFDNNEEVKTENQSPLDLHQDTTGKESADANNCPSEIASSGNSEGLNGLSFDCCCVPVGCALSQSSPSSDDNGRKSIVGEGKNLSVSFDCCSVPVGSCESKNISPAGEITAESVVGPAVIEDSEGSGVDDDKLVAENKTLGVQSSAENKNIGEEVATIPDPVDIIQNSSGSEITLVESVENQHLPAGDMSEGSGIVDLPEKDGKHPTSSCGDSTADILVESTSAADADIAEKGFDASESMNGDIMSDEKQPTDINNTTIETGGVEESATSERSMPTADTTSESVVEEAIDSSMDASGCETVISAPEAVANLGVSVDNDDKINFQDSEDINRSHKDEAAPSSCEIPVVAEVVTRPFYFLTRHPRFEDTNLREQLEVAQLEVDEKTRERDTIRTEIQEMRSTCKGFNDEVEAAVSKERGMRELLRSKRQEMDSLQSMMNRVKNAISVEQIDGRIQNLQHMIEHETLPLNEEKQFIREINQLKQQRVQLSTNVGRGDEIQKAMDEKDKIEERLKALKKEADAIRLKLSRFEDDRKSSKNRYSVENKKVSELQAKFRAANDIRQSAYTHLQSLRKQLYDKNKYFRGYKDDIKTVDNYISTKNKEELHRYCVNQVESFMDLWNNDAEFRKEYIRCNTRSTLRRLGTVDGRSLGPEEKPAVIPPLIIYNSKFAKVKSVPQTFSLEQEKRVATVEAEKIDEKPAMKVVEQQVQTAKSGKSKKSVPADSTLAVSGIDDIEEPTEISNKESKEEEEMTRRDKELARREEELRREEEAVRLKELRRSEEKVKAKEAMERKKRQAEKAQARAALRAQKEAEEREREKERRAKKKEKKKTTALETTDRSVEAEIPPTSGGQTEDVKEHESKDEPNTVTKKPQRPSQFTKQTKSKSIPLPLRSRSKKRMQSWMWLIVVALLVFALFLLGNSGLPLPFGLERFGF